MPHKEKEVIWLGSSLRELSAFPKEVKQTFGAAIYYAQLGGKHPQTKPMKGHKGAGVLEIVEDFDKETYRCIYTVRYGDRVYVLHAFQKKSKKGIATPQTDLDVVKARLKDVKELEGIKS
ncbi:MAG: addiction module toxin RelE [Desulfuromonas sp.]|nr:MAG: addiction module toxin RelE [Desulfuromonas sp.]